MICKLGFIYKIESPSGKVYIGQTVNIKDRFRKYKSLHCKTQPKIYNSLLKYGYDNHKIDIIEVCDLNIINTREVYWIEIYDSKNNGLNCNSGGNMNKIISLSTKQKMSIAAKNRKRNPMSEETKLKISHSNKGKSRPPTTQKTKDKMRSIHLLKWSNGEYKRKNDI
jgi:hypothetical protein